MYVNMVRCAATPCNTLQRPATSCNTLQHPAIPCNHPAGRVQQSMPSQLGELIFLCQANWGSSLFHDKPPAVSGVMPGPADPAKQGAAN